MSVKPWRVKHSAVAIADEWITVRRECCETAGGSTIDPYYVVDYPDTVHILAFNRLGEILTTRQYRHGIKEICLEIPCGRIDKEDPSPVQAVERELLEETGYKGTRIAHISSLASDAGNRSNYLHTFCVYDVEKVAEQSLDPSEEIDVQFMPFAELLSRITRGEMLQTPLVASVLMAARKLGI